MLFGLYGILLRIPVMCKIVAGRKANFTAWYRKVS